MLRQRKPSVKDRDWLSAVHEIECCVLCGRYGVQAAHRNQGKGASMKVSDVLTAAICPTCHHAIDNDPHLDKDQRRAEIDRAILLTIEELHRRGRIGVLPRPTVSQPGHDF